MKRRMKMCAVCGLTTAVIVLSPFSAMSESLNSLAVDSGAGSLAEPLGTKPGNASISLDKLFDESTTTYFEIGGSGQQWAGIKLTTPCTLTSVSYTGRKSWGQRMRGVLIQGANTASFTDAVTLIRIMPDLGWMVSEPITQHALSPASTNAYLYYRMLAWPAKGNGSCGGNCTDLKFFGNKAAEPPSAPTTAPVYKTFLLNGHATFLLQNANEGASAVEIERKLKCSETWQTCQVTPTGKNEVTVTDGGRSPCQFRLRYVNASGVSDWAESEVFDEVANPLAGEWFSNAINKTNKSYMGGGGWDSNLHWFFAGETAFDGTLDGVYAQIGEQFNFVGLDLGSRRKLSAVRFVPNRESPAKSQNCVVEVSNDAAFEQAQVVATTPASSLAAETLYTLTLATPVVARYVRMRTAATGQEIRFAEIEFDAPNAQPRELVIQSSDITNDYAVLSWTADDISKRISIERSEAEGGPWGVVATQDAGTTVWRDTTARVGVKNWYRVTYEGLANDEVPVSHRRAERLERTWDDLTKVRTPCKVIKYPTNPPTGSTTDVNLFDGNVNTHPDIYGNLESTLVKIGVDLGGEYVLSRVRAAPRWNSWCWNCRCVNAVIMAAPATADVWHQAGVPVAKATDFANGTSWYETTAFTDEDAYRYFWVTKPYLNPGSSGDGASFCGNLGELELYGWPATNVADRLAAPEQVRAFVRNDGVELVWKACANATGYRVERMTGFSVESWVSLGETSAPRFADAQGSGKNIYRVMSIAANGDELISADAIAAAADVPPSGIWQGTAALGLPEEGTLQSNAVNRLTLTAGGGDLNETSERFRYVWQQRRDDFDASFAFCFENMKGTTAFTNDQKVAFMVRPSLGKGETFVSPVACLSLKYNGIVVALMSRSTKDGDVSITPWTPLSGGALTNGQLRVVRQGTTVTGYAKGPESAEWTKLGSAEMSADVRKYVYAGASVSSAYLRTTPCTFSISDAEFTHLPSGFAIIVR